MVEGSPEITDIVFGILNFLLGTIGILLNVGIIVGYKYTKSKASNCLLHISVSNLISGLIATVFGLTLLNGREKLHPDFLFCQIPGVCVNLNQITTPLLLSIVTIERLYAITFPARFSRMSFNHWVYWLSFSVSWMWGAGIALAPYYSRAKMVFNSTWGICDFKMVDVLPNHSHASYYIVLFLLSTPLILSWVIIVSGNILVAVKFFMIPVKRHNGYSVSRDSTTGGENSINSAYKSPNSIRKEPDQTKDRKGSIGTLRCAVQQMTKFEKAIIRCTLSLSVNYCILQFIFIVQIVLYMFNPTISVFDLLSNSKTGHLYATLWYYMAMPVTGFINSIMLLKHNHNLRRATKKLTVATIIKMKKISRIESPGNLK